MVLFSMIFLMSFCSYDHNLKIKSGWRLIWFQTLSDMHIYLQGLKGYWLCTQRRLVQPDIIWAWALWTEEPVLFYVLWLDFLNGIPLWYIMQCIMGCNSWGKNMYNYLYFIHNISVQVFVFPLCIFQHVMFLVILIKNIIFSQIHKTIQLWLD